MGLCQCFTEAASITEIKTYTEYRYKQINYESRAKPPIPQRLFDDFFDVNGRQGELKGELSQN